MIYGWVINIWPYPAFLFTRHLEHSVRSRHIPITEFEYVCCVCPVPDCILFDKGGIRMIGEFNTIYDISTLLGEESIDYPGDTPYSKEDAVTYLN